MRLLIWIALLVVVTLGFSALFGPPHPYVLAGFTAGAAIEATAEFQHKTKVFFQIGQAEGLFPGVCENFDFSPEHVGVFKHYLKTGAMRFSPALSQTPPIPNASLATSDLYHSSPRFLVDNIDDCRERPVTESTGAYELTLGNPIVEITGIRKGGGRAAVEFRWHFESLNSIGRFLVQVQATEERQKSDERLTAAEKAIAPFWTGTAEFVDYADGWRVTTIDFDINLHYVQPWPYGPTWPDPAFNWNAFDEDQNR